MKKNFLWLCVVFLLLNACQSSYTYTVKPNESNGVSNKIEADEMVTKMIDPYKSQLDQQMKEIIGEADVDLTRQFVNGEALLGNFCAELMYEQAKKYGGADFSVVTMGGLRVPIGKGDVNVGLVYELMPFDNEFVIITIDGATAEKLIYRLKTENNTSLGNVKATFRRDKLVSATIGGVAFDKTKSYRVAISDYLANGGDYMGFLKKRTKIEFTQVKFRDVIINHFRDLTAAGKKASASLGTAVTYE